MTTPYRVYIAAASMPSEIDRVERWASKLKEIGVEVVSTWPQNIRDVGTANPRDATREQRRIWTRTLCDQIAMANVLWLLCPPHGVTTRGAWYELGVADTCGTDIVCSGDTRQSIVTAIADEECSNDDGAFAVVKGWAEAFAQQDRATFHADKRTWGKRTRTAFAGAGNEVQK